VSAAFLLLLGTGLSLCTGHPAGAAQEPAAGGHPANARAPRITTARCGHHIAALTVTPAAGFDPLTATDAQLLANNLPVRPAGHKALVIWRKFVVGQLKPAKPECNFKTVKTSTVTRPLRLQRPSATGPATTGSCTANYSGNVADGTTYEDAYGTWTVPLGGQSSSGHAESAAWVGIGVSGTKYYPIIQGGSESDLSVPVPYYLWWEAVTSDSSRQNQVLTRVHYRDTIYVHIHFVYGEGQVTLDDETYGWSHTYTYTASQIAPDGNAEWILERPEEESKYYPILANSTTTFTGAEASGPGQARAPLGQLSHDWVNMITTSTPHITMAAPGSISSNGQSFTDQWKAFGRIDTDGVGNC
jgi:hypothetical protein